MKFSDERLAKLSRRMAREITANRAVKTSMGDRHLADLIERTIKLDQKIDEELETEAREHLMRRRNLPPVGSGEYQAAFEQEKQKAAVRRGLRF